MTRTTYSIVGGFLALVAGAFLATPAYAQSNVDVIFEQTPLFDQGDFMPGDTASHWIDVVNNGTDTYSAAIKIENYNDPDDLGDQIEITVTEGAVTRFFGSLQALHDQSQPDGLLLSDVAAGSDTRYIVSAHFPSVSGNQYQQDTVGFDIVIGMSGDTNGGGGGSTGGGTSTGGGDDDTNGTEGGGGGLRFVPPSSGSVRGEQLQPAVTLQKEAALGFANPGTEITYTLNFTNTGDVALENVVVTDVLPAYLTFVNGGGTTRQWNFGTVAAGATESVSYQVLVAQNAPLGAYSNIATLTADNHPDVTATETVRVREGAVAGEQVPENSSGSDADPDAGQVLGEQLPKSGFRAGEMVLLAGMLATAWLGRRRLQRAL